MLGHEAKASESQRVNATVSREEYAALVRLAAARERSVSWLVRDAVRRYLSFASAHSEG